jgi:hypothetical protein
MDDSDWIVPGVEKRFKASDWIVLGVEKKCKAWKNLHLQRMLWTASFHV